MALAKLLVQSVLGRTAQWPNDESLVLSEINWVDPAAERTGEDDEDEDEENDDSDDILEPWPGSEAFGLVAGALAICDQQTDVLPLDDEVAPANTESASSGLQHTSEEATNPKKRRFPKHDPQPNLTAHGVAALTQPEATPAQKRKHRRETDEQQQPFAEQQQHPAAGQQPQASTETGKHVGRKSPFTDVQLDFIAVKSKEFLGQFTRGKSPPNQILHEMIKEGIDKGILPATTTLEQVRQVARTREPPAEAGDVD